MKFRFVSAFLIVLILSTFSYSEEYKDGEVIVVLKSSGSSEVSSGSLSISEADRVKTFSIASESGAEVRKIYPAISKKGGNIFAVLHSDSKDPKEFAEELLNNPEVAAASPNHKCRIAAVPNDPYATEEYSWGAYYVKAPEAWDIETGNQNVYVAVIDTGIDYTNPDLADNVAEKYGKNFVNEGKSAKDDHHHGSHVSGIIGAVGDNGKGIAGICWNVQLIPIKTMSSDGSGYESDIIEGLEYVAELMKEGLNIRAINISIEESVKMAPTYKNLVTYPLWRAMKVIDDMNQAVFTVAAGNYGQTVGQTDSYGYCTYPASFKGINNMLSVSAIDSNGNFAQFSAGSSATGASISAPGFKIYSTVLQNSSDGDNPTLALDSGTSMAAPYAAGAAALLSSANPSLTAYQIKCALLRDDSSDDTSAPSDLILNIEDSLEFISNYEEDESVLPLKAEANSYDNWEDYEARTVSSKGSGGGGGCNGIMINIATLLILIPLVKKLNS